MITPTPSSQDLHRFITHAAIVVIAVGGIQAFLHPPAPAAPAEIAASDDAVLADPDPRVGVALPVENRGLSGPAPAVIVPTFVQPAPRPELHLASFTYDSDEMTRELTRLIGQHRSPEYLSAMSETLSRRVLLSHSRFWWADVAFPASPQPIPLQIWLDGERLGEMRVGSRLSPIHIPLLGSLHLAYRYAAAIDPHAASKLEFITQAPAPDEWKPILPANQTQ